MTSTAISAQGSTVSIGTATSGAKTITAAAPGNPTIFTSAAHGLQNGDVVTLAAIVGTMSSLNGTTWVVTNRTANTIALDADTTGLAYTSGGTATPALFTNIANVKTFTGFDGAASEIDTTNLQSTAKEYLLGLQDPGQFSMELDGDTLDAGQLALLAAQTSGAKKTFKVVLPTAATASFSGFVKKVSSAGGVDQALKRSVDIRVSGPVVWA